ncbi:HEAT repeat domain-containing protein [Chloroflexi bacterium TSY]|nr:HEAT repeat domain-containing protein [Chloroflexi bacterium TSY]
MRQAAASSLGELGEASPQVVEALIQALGDSDIDVRQTAASSLGELGETSSQVIETLIQALGDSDINVRQTAASSLGELGETSPQVIETLIQALSTRDIDVRQAVASSLGELGEASPQVVEALIQALRDNDINVRQTAASSLSRLEIKDEVLFDRTLTKLNRHLHNLDDDIRRNALEVTRTLVDGRPLPGYRWTPIAVRLARRRRIKQVAFWAGLVFVLVLICLVATWLLTDVDENSFVVRFFALFGGLIGFVSAFAALIGWVLRSPFEGN